MSFLELFRRADLFGDIEKMKAGESSAGGYPTSKDTRANVEEILRKRRRGLI